MVKRITGERNLMNFKEVYHEKTRALPKDRRKIALDSIQVLSNLANARSTLALSAISGTSSSA